MSKRKRQRRASNAEHRGTSPGYPSGPEASRSQGMEPQAVMYGHSGYAAANWSSSRGDVWWPTMETRQELDSYSRAEVVRKVRWLYANVGMFRGFVNTGADLIGALTPQGISADKEWVKEAYQIFEDRCGTAAAFDVCGKFDFWTAQPMLSKLGLKDADALTVLTESTTKGAMFAFYESHQIINPKEATPNWTDGVLVDATGRHLAYGLRDGGKGTVTKVSARDAIYFGEFDSPGHVRVVPKLAHAVTTGLDITEIRALVKGSIKTAAMFGAVREAKDATVPRSHAGIAGPPSAAVRERPGNPAAGEPATVIEKVETSNVFGAPVIPRMPSGEELKILHDSRPSPNQMAFMEVLTRDISVGYGLPPEIIWQMAGLTGPGVRFVMDVADRWIRQRQEHLANWARRVWLYTIAKEIKAGRLRMPSDGIWWRVKFVPQRNLTIDRGRDLKGRMEAVAAGLEPEEVFCEEMYGQTASEVRRQHIEGVKEKMDLCDELGVPYEVAYPPRAGSAVAQGKDGEEEKSAE